MKLLVPATHPLALRLPADVTAVTYDPAAPLPPEHHDAEALVAWGNPPEALARLARDLRALRWVQTLAAGPDAVLQAGFDARVVITSGRGLHDGPVREHALALVLALVRRLPDAGEAQRAHRWSTALGGIQSLHPAGRVTTLMGARVLIWGFGSIAQTLAPVLRALGATVTGVARSAGDRAGFPVVAEEAVARALGATDLLIVILPSSPATDRAVDAARLARLPPHALVVNVGRGSTVDEAALVAALRSGRLAAAALDVTRTEPLPADSPLWDAPNLLITPHAAGGRPVGAEALIGHNLAALRAGEPLRNVVART